MEATSERTIEVPLVMNDSEARWLMSYTQNFIGGKDEIEGKKSRAMREGLFSILKEELEGN